MVDSQLSFLYMGRMNAPQTLENETQVASMLKRPFKLHNVFLVFKIQNPQLLQDLRLFQPSFIPAQSTLAWLISNEGRRRT